MKGLCRNTYLSSSIDEGDMSPFRLLVGKDRKVSGPRL